MNEQPSIETALLKRDEREILDNPELLRLFFEYFVINALLAEKNAFTNYFYIFMSNNFEGIDESKYKKIMGWIIDGAKSNIPGGGFGGLTGGSVFTMRKSFLEDNQGTINRVLNGNLNNSNGIEQKFISELIAYLQDKYPMIGSLDDDDKEVLDLFGTNSIGEINNQDINKILNIVIKYLEEKKLSLLSFFESIKNKDKKEVEIKIAIFRISEAIIHKLNEIGIKTDGYTTIINLVDRTLRKNISTSLDIDGIRQGQKKMINLIGGKGMIEIHSKVRHSNINEGIGLLLEEGKGFFDK